MHRSVSLAYSGWAGQGRAGQGRVRIWYIGITLGRVVRPPFSAIAIELTSHLKSDR